MNAAASATAAERAVLGAILADPTAYARVKALLKIEDFDLALSRSIWAAAEHLTAAGTPIGLLTVTAELERTGELPGVGGMAAVAELAAELPDVAKVEHYAAIVKDAADKRRLTNLGRELEDAAKRPERTGAEIAADYAGRLTEVAKDRTGPGPDVGVLLSDVTPESVRWLWQRRIPLGKLTVLDGDPGQGKSSIMLDVASRVTTGRAMPDGTPGIDGGVVVLTAEDGLADTVRPRVEAAGGDVSRIVALLQIPAGDGPRPVTLPDDLEHVRAAIARVGAVLVVVDPLMAFLTGNADAHRDQDVRRALVPLVDLAEETGAAVVLIRHLVKGGGMNPLYRGGGSIGIVAACRSGLLVMADPEIEGTRVLTSTKSNLSAPPASLAYRLEAASEVLRVRWMGESEHTATSLLAAGADQESRGATAEARAFLEDLLRDGSRPAREVKREAEAAGLSWRVVERAKGTLGVIARKVGFGSEGRWTWELKTASDGENKNKGGLSGLKGLSSSSSSFLNTSREGADEDRKDRHSAGAVAFDVLGALLDQRAAHLGACSACSPGAWTEGRRLCPDGETLRANIAAELARREPPPSPGGVS